MLFNSIPFFIFFPIVVLVYFVLPHKIKNYWLLIMSYYFYMSWNAVYGLLLFGCTALTYAAGLIIEKNRGKAGVLKAVLAMSCIIVFGILFYFKYTNFFINTINHFGASIPNYDIVLPVGISFFTFQSVGYLIDVYRGDIYAEKNFFRYMLFIAFFPQLVAGPIERSRNLLKQLDKTYDFDYDRVRHGLLIMLWGYFLKYAIADRSAIFVGLVFDEHYVYNGYVHILAVMVFALEIYGDFMGYSTIARGAALVLGYRLTDNFRQPFFATDVRDLWKRWHISLNSWFVDYLYIPLGGSRNGKLKKYRNIMIVSLISGLWHGANFTYVFWGGINGIYQIIEDLYYRGRKPAVHGRFVTALLRIKTYLLFCFSLIFFRAKSLSIAIEYIKAIPRLFDGCNIKDSGVYLAMMGYRSFVLLGIALVILYIGSTMREKGVSLITWLSEKKPIYRYAVYWILVTMITLSLKVNAQEFLYFQF